MTILQLLGNDIEKTDFNLFAHHPLQSYEWGEAREKMGIPVVRVGEYDGGVMKQVYQMTIHSVPNTPYKIGYIPKSEMPTSEVLQFFLDWGKNNNVIFIKFEPNVILDTSFGLTRLPAGTARMTKSSHPLFPQWTLQLNLEPSEDELLAHMKPKTRYNIRLAQKKGVQVKEMTDDEGFMFFAKLYFDTCKRQNYHGHNLDYHKKVFGTLKNDISHIFVAFFEGKPLVAFELFLYKNVLYYPYGGSSLENRNVMAPNLLMWEAIRFGKNHGAQIFDMWGSAAPGYDEKDPYAGFTRLKEGYGSEFVEFMGSYDLVISPLKYKLYTSIHSLRSFLLSFS